MVVHRPVSMTVTRTVSVGDVVLFVVLMLPVHVKPTVVLIVWQHLVLQCVKMHVLAVVQHVSIHVDSNVVHAHLSVLLDAVPHVILHVSDTAGIRVISIVFILVVNYVAVALICAIHVLVCV